MWTQIIQDAKCKWAVIVDYQPNLIGHEYTFKPLKGKVIKDAYDQEDFNYFKRHTKPPIPEGTELNVDCWWMNFYGDYFKVEYNGEKYDIKTDCIELTDMNG